MLSHQITVVPPGEVQSYLSLIVVLARDLNDDLERHFHILTAALMKIVNSVAHSGSSTKGKEAPNPELAGKLFQCFSHLLKSQLSLLSKEPDCLRQYYGAVLGNSTHYVRDMAAKAFIIVTRKLQLKVFRVHLKKIVNSVATIGKTSFSDFTDHYSFSCLPLEGNEVCPLTAGNKRIFDLFEGVSALCFYTLKGVRGCMQSRGNERLAEMFALALPLSKTAVEAIYQQTSVKTVPTGKPKSSKKKGTAPTPSVETGSDGSCLVSQLSDESRANLNALLTSDCKLRVFSAGQVAGKCFTRIFRHIHPSNAAELWMVVVSAANNCTKALKAAYSISDVSSDALSNLHLSALIVVEILLFSLCHSKGRGLSEAHVKSGVSTPVINAVLDLVSVCLGRLYATEEHGDKLVSRVRVLLCRLWVVFPTHSALTARIDDVLSTCLSAVLPSPAVVDFATELLPVLPPSVVRRHLVQPMIKVILDLSQGDSSTVWLSTLLEVLLRLSDSRDLFAQVANANAPMVSMSERGGSSVKSKGGDEDWGMSDDEEDEDDGSDDDASEASASSWNQGAGGSDDDENSGAEEDEGRATSSLVDVSSSSELAALANTCLEKVTAQLKLQLTSESSGSSVDGLLAAKCLLWISTNAPELVEEREFARLMDGLLFDVFGLFLSAKSKVVEVELPFLSHLVVLCASNLRRSAKFSRETKMLKVIVKNLVDFYCKHAHSVSLSWALGEFLKCIAVLDLGDVDHVLATLLSQDEQDALIAAISSCLSTPSYWLRYNVLRLLTHLPLPTLRNVSEESASEGVQVVDVARICLDVSSMTADISTEREYARLLGMLEVVMRAGRLPTAYVRLVGAFCLGLMHVKFKSIWEPSILVLVSAAGHVESEEVIWPLLLEAIRSIGSKTIEAQAKPNCEALDAVVAEPSRASSWITDCIDSLAELDSGVQQVSMDLACSDAFYFQVQKNTKQNRLLVEPDARTDVETTYSLVWSVLKRCPIITLKRSKVIVPFFIGFLTKQFYAVFKEDPEIPYLKRIGFFAAEEESSSDVLPVLPVRILKRRLEMFLQVLAAVTSPKQLFRHQLLYAFYREIMSKPDVAVVKLAFDCIAGYKPVSIIPYKDNIKRLLDDKTIRDELVSLDLSLEGGAVRLEHREDVIPLLVRTVFGRFVSKSRGSKAAREQGLARRAAALAFLSKMERHETRHLLQLMLRGVLPSALLNANAMLNVETDVRKLEAMSNSVKLTEWYAVVDGVLRGLTPECLKAVPWERQVGFLHLLEQVVKIVGFGLTDHVQQMHAIVLHMVVHAQNTRVETCQLAAEQAVMLAENEEGVDEDDEDEEEEDREDHKPSGLAAQYKNASQSSRVRTLCLLRVSEMIHQYYAVHRFDLESQAFFAAVQPLVVALPGSISGSSKPPAMLRIFHALISYEQTIGIVADSPDTVRTVIMCVASQAEPDVVFMIMESLNALLDWRNGFSILPHAHLIIQSFSKRFVGPSYDSLSELKLSEMHITPSGSVKQELKLLCRIADGVFSRDDVTIDNMAVGNLTTLLLGMLRTYTTSRKVRVEEDWAINILKIYRSLLWRVTDITNHVSFISRLFGPASHSLSLFNLNTVRAELANVYEEMAKHPSTSGLINLSSYAIKEITAEDSKLIGGRDFGRVMPVFQALSGETKAVEGAVSWSSLLGPDATDSPRLASMCTAVVYEVLRCMYDKELIVRSAALASFKRLVIECGSWSACLHREEGGAVVVSEVPADDSALAWLDIMRSVVTPAIRRGIKQSMDVVKKGFVMLLAHVVNTLGRVDRIGGDDMFHADMQSLIHEDPEQNFFENITHIQFHRRMRAMNRLKAVLLAEAPTEGSEQTTRKHSFSASSFVHVLLPLGYHFLFSDEFQKKDHQALMQEAAQFVGAVGLHLQWNHYFSAIKTLLKQLGKGKTEKEKVLLSALCALLDSFHFDLSGEKVLEGLILPDNAHAQELGRAIKTSKAKTPLAKVENSALSKQQREEDEDSDHGSVENGDNAMDENGNAVEQVEVEVDQALSAPPLDIEPEQEEMDVYVEQAVAVAQTPKEESYLVISRAVVNNILPWVKIFLLKEEKDHKGNKSHTVQPHVALALTKLIRRLEAPVVSEAFRSHLFTNLVISVVTTLKSRDASARDIARESLSRMISTLGLGSMKSVFYELTMILKEGFQRHVCNYTVKTILNTAMAGYSPPCDAPSIPLELMGADNQDELLNIAPEMPAFDRSIPLIVACALDDLTGEAQDDRTADTALRSLIREAKGSKANDTLEITAKCLLFRPTYALLNAKQPAAVSSIHALTVPLLDLLVNNDSADLMGRTAEALQRIALGLSRNPSVEAKELLLYLHATLQPFVAAIVRDFDQYRETLGQINKPSGKRKKGGDADEEADDFAALDEDLPSYLREESSDEDERALYSQKKSKGSDVTGMRATSWLPSDRSALLEQRAVVEERNRAQQDRYKVQDGASAPKLSGHNRYKRTTQGLNNKNNKGSGISLAGNVGGASDPSALAAIRFCLTLFNSCLRHDKLDNQDEEIRSMAVPFLPLLGKCLQLPGASNVVALAVKCITTLVGWGIPIEPSYFRALSNRLLKLMFRGGGLVSTENELAQACIKGLTSLFKLYNTRMGEFEAQKEARKKPLAAGATKMTTALVKPDIPLGEKNIRSLLQMLTVSVMEITSAFQNAAFQLIKEVVNTRIMIPEVYDLMTKLAEQIVLSQRKGVREAASSIVVSFIINYPMGDKRVDSQMKQLLNNCSYEYEDGRCAAMDTLATLCKLLPVVELEKYATDIFLSMTLKVVNDKSGKCRVAAADLVVSLTRRLSPETVAQLQGFASKWLGTELVDSNGFYDSNSKALVRTGAQMQGLLVKSRPELLKRSDSMREIVAFTSQSFLALLSSGEAGPSRIKGSIWKREMSKFGEGQGDSGGSDAWAVIYQLLGLLENLYSSLPSATDFAITHLTNSDADIDRSTLLMEQVQEAMLFPHAWVRAVAVRVVQLYLSRRDITRAKLSVSPDGVEILTTPNGLYHLARRLCVVINQPTLPTSMMEPLSTCLVFAIRAMLRNPDLAVVPVGEGDADDDEDEDKVASDNTEDLADDNDNEEEDDVDEEEEEEGSEGLTHETIPGQSLNVTTPIAKVGAQLVGANWVMQRLRGIGADSRGNKRVHVMKVFLLLVQVESVEFITGFVHQIIEVSVRASLAAERLGSDEEAAMKATKAMSSELLSAIEEKVGAAVFIGAFGVIQRNIQSSKSEKKRQIAAEAISNPHSYATKKIAHALKKKESRKRKNEKHALVKGGVKKQKTRGASAIIDYEDF
eukprot:gene23353-29566_t